MKRVLLKFYSKNNLGDDLFIKIVTDRYRNIFSVIASSNTFFASVKNLRVYSSRIIFYFSKVVERLAGKRSIWQSLLAKRNDVMVHIGGSLFIQSGSLKKWQLEKDSYQRTALPYFILGSNVGPYKDKEFPELLRGIFDQAVDVCFRDKASYEIFKDVKTTRASTDIAFTLDTSLFDVRNDKVAILSIIDGSYRFNAATTTKYDQEIINMTNRLMGDGYKVIYMSFCKYEGDETAIQRIIRKLNTTTAKAVEVYNYDGDLEEALSLLATSSIIIGGRFHATILGLLFGKKVLPMAYSDKTINILNDLEFKGDVIDIRKINEFDGSAFDFSKLQINNVDVQIKLAEKQFQELDKVLEKRK